MRKILVLLFVISLSVIGLSQNTSPLIVKDFMLQTNGVMDIDQVPRDARTDWDSNPVCMIQVKAVGFEENLMQKFTFVPNGMDIMHKTIKNGMVILYVSSNKMGEIAIKYMGDCLFKLPYKLEGHKIYTLTLGMESATLIIRSVPNDADIYIDNEKAGTGYGSKDVSIGAEHRYRVESADYWPNEGLVYFDKREEKSLNIELEPNFGYITIKSEPVGANVYIDDVKVGETPYIMKKVKLGNRVVELRKTGYEIYADMVIIKAGEVNKNLEKVVLVEDEKYVEPSVQSISSSQSSLVVPGTKSSFKQCFSVSPNKMVDFSKGNLQYKAATKTWRFAEHQWDIIRNDNRNSSSSDSGWIDIFGWGTGYDPTNSSKKSSKYSSYNDWGNNKISNGGGKNYFTLTKNEWVYVFNTRSTSSGIRYAKATVNGVNGVILLPDNWSNNTYSLSDTNKADASFGSNNISQSDWTSILEANGAVFLPAAGWREGTSVIYVGFYGSYWSSTNGGSDGAYYLGFHDSSLNADNWGYREYGRSVRLVSIAE